MGGAILKSFSCTSPTCTHGAGPSASVFVLDFVPRASSGRREHAVPVMVSGRDWNRSLENLSRRGRARTQLILRRFKIKSFRGNFKTYLEFSPGQKTHTATRPRRRLDSERRGTPRYQSRNFPTGRHLSKTFSAKFRNFSDFLNFSFNSGLQHFIELTGRHRMFRLATL
jgi:hypothetical protein